MVEALLQPHLLKGRTSYLLRVSGTLSEQLKRERDVLERGEVVEEPKVLEDEPEVLASPLGARAGKNYYSYKKDVTHACDTMSPPVSKQVRRQWAVMTRATTGAMTARV